MKGRGGGDDVEGGDMTVSGAPTSISRSIIPLSTHEQANSGPLATYLYSPRLEIDALVKSCAAGNALLLYITALMF